MNANTITAAEVIKNITSMNLGDVNRYKTGKNKKPYCTAELWIGTVFIGIVSKTGVKGKTNFRLLNGRISDDILNFHSIIEAKANALGFQNIAMREFIDIGFVVVA